MPGDKILVDPGCIYYECLVWPQMDGIILTSLSPPTKVIIDAGYNGRVITMTPTVPGVVYSNATVLTYLSLWNGLAPASGGGGGIYMVGNVAPLLEDVGVHSCIAEKGGGIYYSVAKEYVQSVGGCWEWQCSVPPCFMYNMTISDCSATSTNGGGIYVSTQQPGVISACPEIDVYIPELYLINATLEKNEAFSDGGGMYLIGAHVIFSEGAVVSNTAGRYGGGLCAMFSSTELNSISILENAAEKGGGAYFEKGVHYDPANCDDCSGTWDGIEHRWAKVYCCYNYADQGIINNGGGLYFDGL